MLTFDPVVPRRTAGFSLQSLQIHIRDHRRRDVPVADRTLEAHYGGFVLTQSRAADARSRALNRSYGSDPRDIRVAGREGKLYEMGSEPEPDDIEGRMPAVVTWSDGELFYLIASGELPADVLLTIANSMYR
jgi:hypothetical protein